MKHGLVTHLRDGQFIATRKFQVEEVARIFWHSTDFASGRWEYEPRGSFHGLAIELKKDKGGRVSTSQKEWLKSLEMRGFKATVAKGFDEAVKLLEEYLICGKS